MNNAELQRFLAEFPGELGIDVMFVDDLNVYTIQGLDLVELSQGREVLVLNIEDTVPLAAV